MAGRANVLVVPDLEAGNMLAKSLSFLADADAAGIVLGARVPIILTSRADSVLTRLASCAVAALVARRAARSRKRPSPDMSPAHGGCDRRPQRGLVEHQVLAVRRARRASSSSSLRGQAEGLYTAPRFVAKDAAGTRRRTRSRGARASKLGHDGALDHLVAFLRE